MLSNDTQKFWSFKDTKTHKRLRFISNIKVIRTFIFDRSFLLQINIDNTTKYVIPYKFMSSRWPGGSYTGISEDMTINFTDDDIERVIGKK